MCISIGHDTYFEEGVSVANGCNIGGNIHFRKDTFVGMGATIISGVKLIGEKCVIGAGTVIIKDVPDFSVIVGNPGKVIKQTI
jgi:acetyltransferase-like isoleucine patch superfamily enzyme